MLFKHCPGIDSLIRPTIVIKRCPFCNEEVEFFEYETQQECPKCGRIVHREASEMCIVYCASVEECIKDLLNKGLISKERAEELREIYNQVKQKKP
ncbi:MAG: hypothetical protein RMJ31_00970 [Nitrososphaerota archaeon]|nr:hypothetical protein [Nitrososphaerales archaeon]MDW8044336.1 hypothetical protein [Nitrososphaerota archaeon]